MTDAPLLLTPGPLTTTDSVKRAMLRDWGSRDPEFEALTAQVRAELLAIANAGDAYTAVPLQGSGTFAVEAMIATLVAPDDGLLVVANGAYGRRIAEICARMGLKHDVLDLPDRAPVPPARVAEALAEGRHRFVAVIHCETTSGVLNPLAEIAEVCRAAGAKMLVDAMSSFGALPCDAAETGFAALAASSNKCLQGVPGAAFVICDKSLLLRDDHRSPSLVLDLAAQDRQFSADGQWRFTPPTHVIAALAQALDELRAEGGTSARLARYTENCTQLIKGMTALGFQSVLDPATQAPIIVSFSEPAEDWFDFQQFYDRLKAEGFAIYAGKMRDRATFRVGVIGDVTPSDIAAFLDAAGRVTRAMTERH
ncbi:2-aminoethylphosphonate--pyruvate transaminase [Psychromarinibacter halotolerans]|uniref:2-aminoethylphosphonate--pyruvate transaminase n=1 Tax=Psychromarinibacter halotolerans TaxID=1775175 RepID=A0ABV7GT86_9RHOB|nr:2-aminoethylphosphonate--pyruvate transaminase [Psychromarinibacter halotolerans]MDF0594752.1 2-aminoethylphosphonate--pyruvate transaminase [Psychromarinibacter halotolerans]